MLSHIWLADAAPARVLSLTGASFVGGCTAVPRERAIEMAPDRTDAASKTAAATVIALLRPQASAGTVLFGNATHAAGQAKVALQQRTSQKKYARTTRIAALGGGALGPHPARDPV